MHPVSSFLDKWFVSDTEFNQLYPPAIRLLAQRHWTPLHIVKSAAKFLAVEDGDRILDIGSGIGKFCLGAAYYNPTAFYYGVEQRADLVQHAESATNSLVLQNVSFIHENFTRLDCSSYDHFYFYNSFYENLIVIDKIDNSISCSQELYNYYSRYLFRQLEKKPSGTRLATYHNFKDIVPPSFQMIESEIESLKFWIKK